MRTKKQSKSDKPLTVKNFIDALANYNQKVLFPALDERFASKKEFNEFKDQNFKILDKILADLKILKTAKRSQKISKGKR